jgi:drug/metabolite transporter (DMT)-like permease
VFALIIGVAVFGERPDVWTLTGAALIIGSGLCTCARERIRARQFQRPSAMRDNGCPL